MKISCSVKKWDTLTKEERLFRLAKDALIHINAKRVNVARNYYINGKVDEYNKDAREYLLENQCQVCAKGALLVSKILARNNVLLRDIGVQSNGLITQHQQLIDILHDVDRLTLDMMEIAFEGCNFYNFNIKEPYDEWRNRYYSDKERLVAILKRIIKNKGTFTEEDLVNP